MSKLYRKPRSFWKRKVEEFAVSGLSMKAFCTQHQIAHSTFAKWRKELGSQKTKPQFIPLSVVGGDCEKEGLDSWCVSIDHRICVMVPLNFHAPSLKKLMKVLRAC